MKLNEGVAVITGAAGGIGLGIARACLAEGMRVVVSDLDAARLGESASALRAAGGEVLDQACDVRDPAQVGQLRDAALQRFGRVDLLCNNAGLGLSRPVLDTTDADWELLFDVNVTGVINGIRTFLPVMVEQGSGHINSTSSMSGLLSDPGLMVYNGTKFAVIGMMEALGLEMGAASTGVSCSVLCPGPVATDLLATSDKNLVDAGSVDQLSAEIPGAIADALAAGFHPDDVGQIAVDGIKREQFWILTHPEDTFSLLEQRFEAMKRGELYVAPEAWVDQR